MPSPTADLHPVDFVVARDNLRQSKFIHPDRKSLEPQSGQVLLRIVHFAFTANNVTYAVAGDMMAYWNFFPAESGWGKVPVWGFADVLHSNHNGIPTGERIFGYLPMSTHVLVQPERVGPADFVDAASHRQPLPPVYNQYIRVGSDPAYSSEHEDQQMLFRPLFVTAFLLDDFLADNDFFGARTVVLSSASSKTAFGLAHCLQRNRTGGGRREAEGERRRGEYEVVGLTSASHVGFVEGLGCYDRVVTYDRLATLPRDVDTAFVDMAGNGALVSSVHHHFGDHLKHSCVVGLTHWEQRQPQSDLPGVQPTFFFAPTQMQKRTKEWGPSGFQQRYGASWRGFLEWVANKVHVVRGRGEAAVERVYREMLEGRSKPNEAHVLSLWD